MGRDAGMPKDATPKIRHPALRGAAPATSLGWGQDGPGAADEPRHDIDLHLLTVDVQGRIPLRRVATSVGWCAGEALELTPGDSLLQLSPADPHNAVVQAVLDTRLRVQMPYGLWATSDFRPGARLVVLAVAGEHTAVAAPVPVLLRRLLGRP
jgi:hypothetical protein